LATLGIDLGGTFARAAIVEKDGTILAAAKMALTDRTPEAVVHAITQASRDAVTAAGVGPIEGCGVGVAGQLRGETGVIAIAPNLGWREVPFGQMLADALGRPVRVVNDLAAAAWGELHAGAGKGARDLLVVFVGSGVGSCIISNGQIVRGANGMAGELGHIKVVANGRMCGCGQKGCLEAYVGGHNLIAQMREALEQGRPTALTALTGGDPLRLTPAVLEEAARANDPIALGIYETAVGYLAVAIANQVTVLNPARLIRGGGVLTHAPGMRAKVAEGVAAFASVTSRSAVTVLEAALRDDSGLIGAALLAT
jgi:glucokinase